MTDSNSLLINPTQHADPVRLHYLPFLKCVFGGVCDGLVCTCGEAGVFLASNNGCAHVLGLKNEDV